MGIISNGDLSQQQYKLEKAGIRHYFSSLTLSAECGMCKPSPSIFLLACDRMNVHPSETVYVGDRRDIDAEAARRVGMHGIWLDRYGETLLAGEDSLTRIHSLSELPSVRIPMMSISHSDLMPIRSERSDAGLSQCEIVIGIRQDFCLFSLS